MQFLAAIVKRNLSAAKFGQHHALIDSYRRWLELPILKRLIKPDIKAKNWNAFSFLELGLSQLRRPQTPNITHLIYSYIRQTLQFQQLDNE